MDSFYSAEANVELRKLMMMHRSFSYESEGDGGPKGSKIEIYFRRHKFSTIILMDFCEASRMVKQHKEIKAAEGMKMSAPGNLANTFDSLLHLITAQINHELISCHINHAGP